MAWEARSGLKHRLGSRLVLVLIWLNGLGSPFGIETNPRNNDQLPVELAKWPGKPVRD